MHSRNEKPKRQAKDREDRIVRKRVNSLKSPCENWQLYREPDPADDDQQALAADIARRGMQDALIVTEDNFVVSGNRRRLALETIGIGWTRCRVLPILWRNLSHDKRLELLRANNLQRRKSAAEHIRETIIDVDPADAAASIEDQHERSAAGYLLDGVVPIELEGESRQVGISEVKQEHRQHVLRVVKEDRRDYWPTSSRGVHYGLLNYRFLRNTREKIPYRNNKPSYESTCDLVKRMLLAGDLPWEAIADETRPFVEFDAFADVNEFVKQDLERLFDGYSRNLLQSQPNLVVCFCEKNTIFSMAQRVTEKFQVPTISGRGFCSIAPLKYLADRFFESGKETLILITLSDFDPEGSLIPHVAGRTLRDDFGVDVDVIPAGVTREQIERYALPKSAVAKESSSNWKWFVERNNGDDSVYELEALDPAAMLEDLEDVIRSVLDIELFNAEVDQAKDEVKALKTKQKWALNALKGMPD